MGDGGLGEGGRDSVQTRPSLVFLLRFQPSVHFESTAQESAELTPVRVGPVLTSKVHPSHTLPWREGAIRVGRPRLPAYTSRAATPIGMPRRPLRGGFPQPTGQSHEPC